MKHRSHRVLAWAASLFLVTVFAHAQDYLLQTGAPTFTTAEPVEMGFINASNGNLHLEIPLASPPQRGRLRYGAKLVYDSRIWEASAGTWHPDNVPNSQGGWRLVTSGSAGNYSYSVTTRRCLDPNTGQYYTIYNYTNFMWTAPEGTRHKFPVMTIRDTGGICDLDTPTGDALANDSSGYRIYVTGYTTAKVFAKDGTQVYNGAGSDFTVKDPNGNYFSIAANVIDTLGRTVVTYVPNGAGCTASYCYNILAPNGSTSQVQVTTTTVNVNTNFGQSGVTEYSGSFTAIQSIALPNNTNYSFTYDSGTGAGNFGLMKTIKLPTGTGTQVTYSWTTFADSYVKL